MRHTLFCVLGLFLLNTLCNGIKNPKSCKHCRSVVNDTQSKGITNGKSIVNKEAVVTLQPNWPRIYANEVITLRCEIRNGGDTEWEYVWRTTSSTKPPNAKEYRISANKIHSGHYTCIGRNKNKQQSYTKWSAAFKLTVYDYKTKPVLTASSSWLNPGASVTLKCSVEHPSAGWRIYWYKAVPKLAEGTYSRRRLPANSNVSKQNYIVHGQQRTAGYYCRAVRGNPAYYTQFAGRRFVWSGEMVGGRFQRLSCFFAYNALLLVGVCPLETNGAVVTLQPKWPKIYAQEVITLTCEIQNGLVTKREYEWKTTSTKKPPNKMKYRINAYVIHNGNYTCIGRNKTEQQSSTKWSDAFKLTVYGYKPYPVLTVSPSWLSPGASVTLKCSVEHPSAGWRIYWYKAVPKLAERTYSRRLLLISDTAQNSYIVHGPTHTTGYLCRAGRGDPVFYTQYSEPKFLWSGDLNPAASLTVNPDRVQHFSSESVSLSCEGNSTEWRVKRFTETGQLSYCYGWGTMTGSTCNIHSLQYSDAVYWCESGSGEYSNAVNITVHSSTPESSSFLPPLLTGVFTGALLIILLLLLYRFIKSKAPCSDRPTQSQSTNQDELVNQDVTQEHLYSTLLQGDVCTYETIGGCEVTGNDGQAKECSDATFNLTQLKGLDKKSEHDDPVENSGYYNVNPH